MQYNTNTNPIRIRIRGRIRIVLLLLSSYLHRIRIALGIFVSCRIRIRIGFVIFFSYRIRIDFFSVYFAESKMMVTFIWLASVYPHSKFTVEQHLHILATLLLTVMPSPDLRKLLLAIETPLPLVSLKNWLIINYIQLVAYR